MERGAAREDVRPPAEVGSVAEELESTAAELQSMTVVANSMTEEL
jgi:hypothetical protein